MKRRKRFIDLFKKRSDGFFQLCILALIGIIGVAINIEVVEIRQLKQEIQIIKKWME